jgi:hypothetical protein
MEGGIPLEAVVVDHTGLSVVLRIAKKAKHPCEFGLSDRAIAGASVVNDKTVAEAADRARAIAPRMSKPKKSS